MSVAWPEPAAAPPRADEPVPAGGGRGDFDRRGGAGRDSTGSTGFSMVPLGWLAAGSIVVGVLLYAVQRALRLPSGFGVEDILGWRTPAVVVAAVLNWCPPISQRWHAAAAYVLADTAFFMPFYGALILVAARGLGNALQTGPAFFAKFLNAALQPAAWLGVALLWVVDGLENFGGAQRIGVSTWAFFVSVAIALLLFATFWRTASAKPDEQRQHACRNVAIVLVALVVTALVVLVQDPTAGCDALRANTRAAFGFAWAHRLKPLAIVLALLPIGFAAIVWCFGIDLDLHDTGQKQLAEFRAAWRAGVAGVVGRTRYVLLMLALFATFTLVLDQCRDVLLALAGPLGDAADRDAISMGWRALVLVLGAGSIGMLAYSCWLWTRLVGMVRRPGLALPGGHNVQREIGEFARGWARAVSLAPLVIVCLLIAHTAGDAVTAARAGPGTAADNALTSTLAYLLVFGAIAVVSGYVFLEVRRRYSLPLPESYYNSEPDAYTLLRTGTIAKRDHDKDTVRGLGGGVFVAEPKSCFARVHSKLEPIVGALKRFVRRFIPITLPIVLPLLALALMLLLRACMAEWPNTTAQAPATLALLCLALVWWMGVAGAMSLAEQRQTIPWGLFVVGLAGALSYFGLANNHVMPLDKIAASSDAALAVLRDRGLQVTALLACLGAVLWLVMTYRAAAPPGAVVPPSLLRARVWRSVIAAAAIAGVFIALHLIDRSTSPLFGPTEPVDAGRTLDAVMKTWVAKLPKEVSAADNRVYLVASEGGGIRSAYWTAQVLAQLHDRAGVPSFDSRTVVLSGVSGGAVGEAAYIACLRQNAGHAVSDCVKARFARLDALSPLIGGFMFEDVFARVLPLHSAGRWSMCQLPACGFLSRAPAFEREWTRQFPALAESIGRRREGEPELMLNSTWVESGNRATFSTMRLPAHDTPASEDPIDRLGAQPSLITAAHAAARFPFINPLAALERARGAADAGKPIGHLADGGYHDNSGTESLADVWRSLALPPGWVPQLVLIRNGQIKAGCDTSAATEPEISCLTAAPSRAVDLAAPLDKAQWSLYADLLGPAVALVNVSGIGARGRQAPAALSADLARVGPAPWLLDQTNEATLVPLGWYLSPAAREALDLQAKCKVAPASCPPLP